MAKEFGVSESYSRFATVSLFVGLIVGASFWGIASDAIGRRPAFNCTLFICGTFGLAAGGGNSWVAYVIFLPSIVKGIVTNWNLGSALCTHAWVWVSVEICPSTQLSSSSVCLPTPPTF